MSSGYGTMGTPFDGIVPEELLRALGLGGGAPAAPAAPADVTSLFSPQPMGGTGGFARPAGPNPDVQALFLNRLMGPPQSFQAPADAMAPGDQPLSLTVQPRGGAARGFDPGRFDMVDPSGPMPGAMASAPLPPRRPASFEGTPETAAPARAAPVARSVPSQAAPAGSVGATAQSAAAPAKAPTPEAQAAAPTQGAATANGPAAPGTPFMDRFMKGISDNSDLFLGIGTGLLSKRGFGAGLAAGIENYQKASNQSAIRNLADAKFQMERLRFAQAQGSTAALAQMIKGRNPGMSDTDAMALALNPAYANGFAQQLPGGSDDPNKIAAPPPGYTRNASGGLVHIPGGPADPKVLGEKAEAQAIDRTQTPLITPEERRAAGIQDDDKRSAWQKAGGGVVFAPNQPVPRVTTFENSDGSKTYGQMGPDGVMREVKPPGSGDNRAKGNPYATGKFNEGQGKAAGFTDRMLGAEPILRQFETINMGPTARIEGSDYLPNEFKSEDRQQFEQAKRNFINAQLRRESGAAISPSEFDNANKQYFPVAGDGPKVIAQKLKNRQDAITAMGREGGPAYIPSHVFDAQGQMVPYQPGGAPSAPIKVASPAEAAKLPSGTPIELPDGTIGRVP